MKKKIKLIIKFLGKEANLFELERLGEIIENNKIKNKFDQLVKIHYLLSYGMKNYDVNEAKTNFRKTITKNNSKWQFNSIQKIAVAASFLFLVGVTIFYSKADVEATIITNIQPIIEKGTDKATLTLEDGSKILLTKGGEYVSDKVSSNGEELVYKSNKDSSKEKIAINVLTIPRGGQFYVVLADGTKVWMNSETQLKYPVNFTANATREVELIYGEAFFEVSPSEKHHGAHFVVHSAGQQVEVLGTEFNIKAYKEDKTISTTLIEGKVVISTESISKNLSPGHQAVLNIDAKSLAISEVNTYDVMSWKNGLFSFENQSFEEIMNVLSRWYDIKVIFENEELKQITFNGIFRKSQPLNEILDIIENTNEVNYTINEKTITMK